MVRGAVEGRGLYMAWKKHWKKGVCAGGNGAVRVRRVRASDGGGKMRTDASRLPRNTIEGEVIAGGSRKSRFNAWGPHTRSGRAIKEEGRRAAVGGRRCAERVEANALGLRVKERRVRAQSRESIKAWKGALRGRT